MSGCPHTDGGSGSWLFLIWEFGVFGLWGFWGSELSDPMFEGVLDSRVGVERPVVMQPVNSQLPQQHLNSSG